MRWFTSDLHLGHGRILDYEPRRPFADVTAMNDGLISRWNNLVAADDEVWVLGDLAMGQMADTLPLIGRLHGRVVLVAGNHDRVFTGRADWRDWTGRYLDAGVAEIVHEPCRLTVAGVEVLVSHFPYRGDSRPGPDRWADHRPVDAGLPLLHGHVHSRWQVRPRQINVGVDAWGMCPVAERTLGGLFRARPELVAADATAT